MPVSPTAWGAGGGLQIVTTQTVTTDPNTFMRAVTYDLGDTVIAAGIQVDVTITALHGDGETWGTGLGQIQVSDFFLAAFSTDGVTYSGTGFTLSSPTGDLIAVNDTAETLYLSLRFGRLTFGILDDAGNVYSGANHPTATASVAVTVSL